MFFGLKRASDKIANAMPRPSNWWDAAFFVFF